MLGAAVIIVYNLPGTPPATALLPTGVRARGSPGSRCGSGPCRPKPQRYGRPKPSANGTPARIAVAEERTRIARELHDIVAHAVSVMVLQVGAVRHGLPAALANDRDTLRGVEQVGRTALTEMRRLLAAMRLDGEEAELMPHPGLDNLDSLVDEIGRAGLPVVLHVGGQPVPLPPCGRPLRVPDRSGGPDQRAEARAGDQGRADPDYRPGELRIDVRDDGVGAAATDGLGHGLLGIRERVKIYGGEMTAGPAPERRVRPHRAPADRGG